MHTFDTQLITVGPHVPAAAVPDAAAGGSRECPGRRLRDTMPGEPRGARHTCSVRTQGARQMEQGYGLEKRSFCTRE